MQCVSFPCMCSYVLIVFNVCNIDGYKIEGVCHHSPSRKSMFLSLEFKMMIFQCSQATFLARCLGDTSPHMPSLSFPFLTQLAAHLLAGKGLPSILTTKTSAQRWQSLHSEESRGGL